MKRATTSTKTHSISQENRERAEKKMQLGCGIGMLSFVALSFIVNPILDRDFRDGSARGALLLGERLIVGEEVIDRGGDDVDTTSIGRIVVLDARTGEERGRALVESVGACEASGTEGIYCGEYGDLHYVAVPSLEVTDMTDAAKVIGRKLDYDTAPHLLADRKMDRVYARPVDGGWLAFGPGASLESVDQPQQTRTFSWAKRGLQNRRAGPSDLVTSFRFDEGLPPGQSWITYRGSLAREAPHWLLVQLEGREVLRTELGFPGDIKSVLPWEGGALVVVTNEDGTRVLSIGVRGELRWQTRL